MSFLIQDRDLFKDSSAWGLQTGLNVNPVPSLSFNGSSQPDGSLLVTNVLAKEFGGALLANQRPVPSIPGVNLNYLGLDLKVAFPSLTLFNLGRHEFDLKLCVNSAPNATTPIPNVADFSMQLNFSTGTFQIRADWADTGIKPASVAPDVWHALSTRYWYDPVAKVCSILSIGWDGIVSAVPTNLQKVPFLTTNWGKTAALQAQNEGFIPGVVLVKYDAGVLTYSDRPF